MILILQGKRFEPPVGIVMTRRRSFGYALNLDFAPRPTVLGRIEGWGLGSKHPVFGEENTPQATNLSLSTSLSVAF
ncbi:MAG: hypothetical protein HC913_22430 [Microscillaceae bacterium]|nr:hypothetical protein [Microscillaceae bacterium]